MSNNYRIQNEMGWVGFNLDKLNYWKTLTIGDQETLYLYFSGADDPLIFKGKNAQQLTGLLKGSFRNVTPND